MRLLRSGQEVPQELDRKVAAAEQRATELEQQTTSTPSSTPSKAAGDTAGSGDDSANEAALKDKVMMHNKEQASVGCNVILQDLHRNFHSIPYNACMDIL